MESQRTPARKPARRAGRTAALLIRASALVVAGLSLRHAVAFVGAELIVAAIEGIHRCPRSPKTRQHALAAMRQVLSAGVVWGYLEVSPARPEAVKAPPSVEPDVRPFQSWEEVHDVASKAGEFGPLIRFACATGLRPEEWIALRWGDIDRGTRTCRVHRTFTAGSLSRDAKTAAALRSVALQGAALDALEELPTPLRSTQLVFPGSRGGHLNLGNFRKRVWYEALGASGLDRRPLYQMRHTYATLALAAGARIEWVSRQMGHRDIRTTLRFYARFLPSVDTRNLGLLDEFARTAPRRKSDRG